MFTRRKPPANLFTSAISSLGYALAPLQSGTEVGDYFVRPEEAHEFRAVLLELEGAITPTEVVQATYRLIDYLALLPRFNSPLERHRTFVDATWRSLRISIGILASLLANTGDIKASEVATHVFSRGPEPSEGNPYWPSPDDWEMLYLQHYEVIRLLLLQILEQRRA